MLFWLILMAVDSSGYGAGVAYPTDWYPLVSLLMVALAMGAGEARFHLYRRVWSVAGLNDAFAIGLAVIEASLLITIINLLFPDGYRPLRILAPVLAAPAVVIGVGPLQASRWILTPTRAKSYPVVLVGLHACGHPSTEALRPI